ncbi:DUF1152 domain-containing protein [Kitasatospora sp. NPDC127111]|uniref:DUF1152 domain-containing protein n=1 Tax=Kitasatospora sp. NPDC127111 TaxID=3345363 RepID=UPI00363511ED
MKRIVIAAGGGGDPIAAAMVGAALYGSVEPVLVLTYAWERLTVDPLPGPRGRADFAGLESPRPHLELVTGSTTLVGAAGSSLPRLAADLGTALGLLDPAEGAVGLARTIRAAAEYCGAGHVDVVDVGGGILATGDEPTLRSPLGDALVLAACARTGLAADVWIAGPALDRELPEAELFARLPEPAFALTDAHVRPVRRVFGWHPSEAGAMLAAAARGVRGLCGIRDVADPVRLDGRSAGVHRLALGQALALNPLAGRLADCATLDEAERAALAVCGFSELARERDRARAIGLARAGGGAPSTGLAPAAASAAAPAGGPGPVERYARWRAGLARQGLTLATRRRVIEELALDAAEARRLHARLAADPAQDATPLWRLDTPA